MPWDTMQSDKAVFLCDCAALWRERFSREQLVQPWEYNMGFFVKGAHTAEMQWFMRNYSKCNIKHAACIRCVLHILGLQMPCLPTVYNLILWKTRLLPTFWCMNMSSYLDYKHLSHQSLSHNLGWKSLTAFIHKAHRVLSWLISVHTSIEQETASN